MNVAYTQCSLFDMSRKEVLERLEIILRMRIECCARTVNKKLTL